MRDKQGDPPVDVEQAIQQDADRRRRGHALIKVGGLLAAITALIWGGVWYLSPEMRAGRAARNHAAEVAEEISRGLGGPKSVSTIGRIASEKEDVDVLDASGGPTTSEGVTLIVRVSGGATRDLITLFPKHSEQMIVRYCYRLTFNHSAYRPWQGPSGVECPETEPLSFGPWPKAPEIPDERLKKLLPKVPRGEKVSLDDVRKAVEELDLDPQIDVDLDWEGNEVGLALSVLPPESSTFDCTLAIVEPGRTEVWTPSRVQRMVGEGGCNAHNAIDPMPPPH